MPLTLPWKQQPKVGGETWCTWRWGCSVPHLQNRAELHSTRDCRKPCALRHRSMEDTRRERSKHCRNLGSDEVASVLTAYHDLVKEQRGSRYPSAALQQGAHRFQHAFLEQGTFRLLRRRTVAFTLCLPVEHFPTCAPLTLTTGPVDFRGATCTQPSWDRTMPCATTHD